MNRIARQTRPLLGIVAAAALAGCGAGLTDVNFSFDTPKDVQLDATGTSVNGAYGFDLSSNATVQQYKTHVKALRLDSLDITITDTTTAGSGGGTNAANSITGTVALRPAAATNSASDVQVGSLTNFGIAKGAATTLAGSAALNAFVLTTLQGSGQFSVAISGSTTPGAAHLQVHLVPHLTLTYSL